MNVFPLHNHTTPEKIIISTIAPNNNMRIFPEHEIEMVRFIIGEKDHIKVGFTDKLGSGYGGSNDYLIDEYIQNTLSEVYRRYIYEWIGDNFRVSDIIIHRDRNDLNRINIQATIASYFMREKLNLLNEINSLNDIIDARNRQVKLLSEELNKQKSKPLFKIAIERIKGLMSRGK